MQTGLLLTNRRRAVQLSPTRVFDGLTLKCFVQHSGAVITSFMETKGIVNLRLTKCEMIQYRVFKKTMTAICCSHVRL